MLKKLGVTFFMVAIIFGLVACSAQNTASNKENEELAEKIGQKKEVVFKDLELEEEKDIELSDNLPGVYLFNKERNIHGEEFKLGLNFDVNTDIMYGFTYVKEIDGDLKEGYDLVRKISEELTEEIGDPDTYPGLPNKISEIPDFDEIETSEHSDFLETWELDGDLSLQLRVKFVSDAGALITLQYAELE